MPISGDLNRPKLETQIFMWVIHGFIQVGKEMASVNDRGHIWKYHFGRVNETKPPVGAENVNYFTPFYPFTFRVFNPSFWVAVL